MMEKNIPLSGLPRWAEIMFAISGTIVLLPLIVTIAFLIKISGNGPILFSQRRVGVVGQEFIIYKFRTMRLSKFGPLVTAADDDRITTFGKMLRKTKLDELPELWNIIKGDMSFVGPRPEVPEFVNLNDQAWKIILQARPGLTDPVTLKLRNEEILLASVVDKKLTMKRYCNLTR